MDKPKWMEIAEKEIGVKEVPGPEDNARILEYHSATQLHADNEDTSWCAAFVCWVLEKSGIKSTKSAAARSFLTWGEKLDKPKTGCICVFKRGNNSWQGHVTFYYGEEGDSVLCLGGNQNNSVCISKYPKSALLGYRWPTGF